MTTPLLDLIDITVRASQCAQILSALQNKRRLTPLTMLTEFGCLRASGRIYDLKHGEYDGVKYPILKDMVEVGNRKRVAEYFMEDESKNSSNAAG